MSTAMPHDLEAELSVLGAMLLSPRAIAEVAEVINAADFYRPSHGVIFQTALGMFAASQPVEPVTLADKLDQLGQLASVGGKAKIHEIVASVPAASNAAHYARIVREFSVLRGLIVAGHDIIKLGEERSAPTDELVDIAEQQIFDLRLGRSGHKFETIDALVKQSLGHISYLHESGSAFIGIPSGFSSVDRLTNGFQPGNLIIIAARPNMGKSSYALNIAANVAIGSRIPVALFTLEMSKAEVTQRLMCAEAKIESQTVATGHLREDHWGRLAATCDKLIPAPLFIDDSGSTTILELRSKARRLKMQEPQLGLVIIDYLQLMSAGGRTENRVQEVSQISRQLKILARDLDLPIVCLSQLSRAVEQRHDKRPILSDLRESGSIEQDSDLVIFIYRDEYYNAEDSTEQDTAEIILAKHRNGPTGTIKLHFSKRYTKFSDLETTGSWS